MPKLLFQPQSVTALAMIILTGVMFIYLLTVKEKSKATKYLTATVAGFLTFWIFKFLSNSLSPAFRTLQIIDLVLAILVIVGLYLACWAFMVFSYHFIENPFKKESKIVTIVAACFVLSAIGLIFYSVIVQVEIIDVNLLFAASLLILSVYGISVFIRKIRYANKETR